MPKIPRLVARFDSDAVEHELARIRRSASSALVIDAHEDESGTSTSEPGSSDPVTSGFRIHTDPLPKGVIASGVADHGVNLPIFHAGVDMAALSERLRAIRTDLDFTSNAVLSDSAIPRGVFSDYLSAIASHTDNAAALLAYPRPLVDTSGLSDRLSAMSSYVDLSSFSTSVGQLLVATQTAFEGLASSLDSLLGGWNQIVGELPVPGVIAGFESSLVRSHFVEADERVHALGQRLAERGWWLYPLTPYLPFSTVESLKEYGESASDPDLESAMCQVLLSLLREGSLVTEVSAALEQLDPVGARLRIKVLRQCVRAFKLRSLDAMIPPVMYGQCENLVAVASDRGTLEPGLYQVFNSRDKKPKKIIDQMIRSKGDLATVDGGHHHKYLPVSFAHQPKIIEVLFRQLVANVSVHDYKSEDDIRSLAAGPTSRHYATHGGLGYERAHAGQAIAFFVGTAFLLRDLMRVAASRKDSELPS